MLEREIWQSYNSKIFYAICLPIKKKKDFLCCSIHKRKKILYSVPLCLCGYSRER
jgi:hypothetical protein